jgi:hypothetical protein
LCNKGGKVGGGVFKFGLLKNAVLGWVTILSFAWARGIGYMLDSFCSVAFEKSTRKVNAWTTGIVIIA